MYKYYKETSQYINGCSFFLFFGYFYLKESKGPALKENVIQENITSTHPAAMVMSEIPLESLFDDVPSKEPELFIEKGLNDAETKEAKPDSSGTIIVTTSRTVVKGDGSPVTTVEKKVVVNGEEQPVDTNLLSPPVETEVDEKTEEGSEEVGDKGEAGEKEEAEGAEGGKPRQKVKKKKSFKKTFQGIMHRRSKSEKDEDEEKS